MNVIVEFLNGTADRWVDGIWPVIWQTAILAAVVCLLTLCLRQTSAAARFWLWMLVPLRLLLMPFLTLTLPLLPAVQTTLAPTPVFTTHLVASAEAPAGASLEPAMGLQFTEVSHTETPPEVVQATIWTYIMVMWLIGVTIFTVRLAVRWRRVKRVVAQAEEATDLAILTTARNTAERLALRKIPRIVLTRNRVSPLVFGIWRPTVVLPRALVDHISSEELLAVLAHEFVHVQRRDILVGWVVTLCEALYFFHPAFQIAKRCLMLERERACDERVLAYSQAKRSVYGRGLLAAADICRGFTSRVSPVPEVAETFGDLQKRVTFICSDRQPRAHLSRLVAIVLTLFTLLCLPRVALTARSAPSTGTSAAVASSFSATLPNGVRVQLLGVRADHGKGEQWWRPDGTLLEQPIHVQEAPAEVCDYYTHTVVFKVEGCKDAIWRAGKFAGSDGRSQGYYVKDDQGNRLNYDQYRAYRVRLEEGQLTTSTQLGFPEGEWHTEAEHDGKTMGMPGGIAFSKATDTRHGLEIVVSDSKTDLARRVVAIDRDWATHVARAGAVASYTGKLRQTTARFPNLKLANIRKFQFQTCPYAWVTFRNISLVPGRKTDIVSRVALTARSTSSAEAKADVTRPFTATFANGISVELMGVCADPGRGAQWWRPDGSPLKQEPFPTTESAVKSDKDMRAYQFVARLRGTVGTTIRWSVPGGTQATDTGRPWSQDGKQIDDLRVYTVTQSVKKTSATVRLGVAAGKWETLAKNSPSVQDTYSLKDGSVAFLAAYEKDGATILPLTHTYKTPAVRVVAINHAGHQHGAISTTGRGGNVLVGGTYKFMLPLKEIKEFQFQVRPFQWVSFHNVSLKPRHITNVHVSIDEPIVVKSDASEVKAGRSSLNVKIAQLDIDNATVDDVIKIFGEPVRYLWGRQTFAKDDLPSVYILDYPDSFQVLINDGRISELRHEGPNDYLFRGKLHVGSSLEEVLQVVGQPSKTVVGKAIGWVDNVLYKDVDGKEGYCYYARSDQNFRFFFVDYKVKALYVTRSDFGRRSGGSFLTVRPVESVKDFDDVRCKDLSKLNLADKKNLIATLWFNQKTVWPKPSQMVTGCDPKNLLTSAMNPGLGIRKLHEQGITGKGVNVAIIDQPLYQDHPEFAGKIVAYHDTGCGSQISMHGPAVTSLLVGNTCGTAPGARVYYAAAPSWQRDTAYEARALNWVIEQNKKLPPSQRIRVVSVSAAPSGRGAPRDKNQHMWDKACNLAEAAGILVLDCTSHRGIIGPCWYDADDPENVAKCTPGYRGKADGSFSGRILAPTAPRTTAEEYVKGDFSYQYCGRGGLSLAIPYAAGVLALGWQVQPDLSAEQMRKLLFASAYKKEDGTKIINPERFIQLTKKAKPAGR